MTREFLLNFKVGDQTLPKEIVDAILDENNRDIGGYKSQLEAVTAQLQTAKDGLKAFEGVDVAQLKGQITKLQGDLETKENEHKQQMAEVAFMHALESAITGAKGKSVKAILGELGPEKIKSLKESKNQEADIKAALEGLQKDSGYLFNTEGTPPPYAPGTGSGGNPPEQTTTLAGALRDKFFKN